jgi:hypothetical protein
MKVSPTVLFWVSLITTIGQGVTSGTVHLTSLVPMEDIPTVTAWVGLIVFVNMSFLTAMAGYSSAQPGPLAPPPTMAEAQEVMKQAQEGQHK